MEGSTPAGRPPLLPPFARRIASYVFPADVRLDPPVIASRIADVRRSALKLRDLRKDGRRGWLKELVLRELAVHVAYIRPYRRHPDWPHFERGLRAIAAERSVR